MISGPAVFWMALRVMDLLPETQKQVCYSGVARRESPRDFPDPNAERKVYV
jgi:hypothetical protein